jgi:hypothetical protein
VFQTGPETGQAEKRQGEREWRTGLAQPTTLDAYHRSPGTNFAFAHAAGWAAAPARPRF